MLPSKKRLSRGQFTTLLSSPRVKVVYNRLGTLKFIPSTDSHMSVIVSSKHEKRAAHRNTLKRRVYALVAASPLPITAALYTSKQSYILEYDELKKIFYDLWKKASQ